MAPATWTTIYGGASPSSSPTDPAALVGVVSAGALGTLTGDVFFAWTAAAPVVLFGAPLGALAVTLIPRVPTMVFVAVLCLGQLAWAVTKVGASPEVLLGVGVGLLAANGVFHALFVAGHRLHPHHTTTAQIRTE